MEHHYHAGRHLPKLTDKGEACYPHSIALDLCWDQVVNTVA